MEDEARVPGMRAEQDDPDVEGHMRRLENEEPSEDDSDRETDEPDVEGHMNRPMNRGRNQL